MNLFQSSLYLFSSLLQADAAILGFGTVFIIYKLQSLETRRQAIIQMYNTTKRVSNEFISELIVGKDVEYISINLRGYKPNKIIFEDLTYILCIPDKQNEISSNVKLPVLVIASQAIVSSIMLWVAQFLYNNAGVHHYIVIINLIWFACGIILASRLAIKLLTGKESITLESYRKIIVKRMLEIDEEERRKIINILDKSL